MITFLSPGTGFTFSSDLIEEPVPVCLFTAGSFPDKGVTITADDLDTIVRRFHEGAAGGSVPVTIDHQNGPLDPLGEVVAIYHKSGKLYGAIQFSSGIADHLRARDAGKFSVGFTRHEDGGFVLDHVSVTATPRVSGTGFLSPVQVGETLARFSREGKLTPAMMEPAARLLSSSGSVNFSDGSSAAVAADVIALLDALPIVQPRGSAVPVNFSRPDSVTVPAGTLDLAKQYGVDPEKVKAFVKGQG